MWSTSQKVLFCNHPYSLCKSPLSCFLPHFLTETVRKTSEAQLGKRRCVQYWRCWIKELLSCVRMYNFTICSFGKKLLSPKFLRIQKKCTPYNVVAVTLLVWTIQCLGGCQQSMKRVFTMYKAPGSAGIELLVNSMECS